MEELLKAIEKVLQEEQPGDILPKLGEGYQPIPFSVQNYYEIPQKETNLKLVFIDGGNAELLHSPNFSLSFVRIVATKFIGTKKRKMEKTEFYLLTTARGGEEIQYTSRIFPVAGDIFPQEKELSFSSLDGTLRQGMRRATPSSLAGVARRFSELLFAQHFLENEDVEGVVLDGNLQETYTNESLHLRRIAQLAHQKKKSVVSVGKTTTILTNTGRTFASVLNHQEGSWYYHPVGKTEDHPEIYFAKLHPASKHVFMIDSFGKIPENTLSSLKAHARDPVFLGYPYGLVEVDRAARISNQEANYLKTKLVSLLSTSKKELQQALSTMDAHSILDTISF